MCIKKCVITLVLTIETGMGPPVPLAYVYGDTRYPILNDDVWGDGSTLPVDKI